MKAIFLIKTGEAANAFETREIKKPVPGPEQVLIKVAASGLNFADIMARRGMYKEAPPIPCVLGYDVAGTVAEVGKDVKNVKPGDRVTAMTRFGGYAEYALTEFSATTIIPNELKFATATSLATQYCTAYYLGAEMVNLHEGDRVLIHSGAGGVGSALIQLATHKKCEIFSTAGSPEKLNHLTKSGVHHPINYVLQDFETEIKSITNGKGVDVIFDAVGGKSVKKGFRTLAPGGRILCYGAADMSNKNIFGKILAAINFGIYHPVMFMMASKGMIGVNMLRIADSKPTTIQHCLKQVTALTETGIFIPAPAKVFPVSAIAAAHDFLEQRKSMGKVTIQW